MKYKQPLNETTMYVKWIHDDRKLLKEALWLLLMSQDIHEMDGTMFDAYITLSRLMGAYDYYLKVEAEKK